MLQLKRLKNTTTKQVRENYLESIDNIIEVDQETIKESNASTRYVYITFNKVIQ